MTAGIGILQLHVGDDGDKFLHWLKRSESRRKLVENAFARRSPAGDVAAHWHVNESKPAQTGRCGRSLGQRRQRRDHRTQQWQRKRGTDATQEGAPRHCFLGDDHSAFLIWKGWLVAMPTTSEEKR